MILGHGLEQKVDEIRGMEQKRYGIRTEDERPEQEDMLAESEYGESSKPEASGSRHNEPYLREEDKVGAKSTLAMFIAALIVAVPAILLGAALMILVFWLFTFRL